MTILMKRILKITFWVLFILLDVVGIMSLSNSVEKGQYTVDTEEFQAVIEYGDEIALHDIKIIDNRLFGLVETELTEDMIVSIEDTSTAGQKKVVFQHNNKQFTVIFDIKYRVEFLSYGEVIDTQLVVAADDLTFPTPKAKPGYEFSHWDYDFSSGINDNIQVNAVFKELDYPTLPVLNATYGDTLADFSLPSNALGRWEFLDPSDTPVGNAGTHYFNVRFVFNIDEGYYKYGSVVVNVAKKQVDFRVDTESFVYDGEAHFPKYTASEDVVIVTDGKPGTLPGVYEYSFTVVEPNYVGSYVGTYEIIKPTVVVTVPSYTIVYPQAMPEISYTVEGHDNVDNCLGIELVLPNAAAAGIHTIGVKYDPRHEGYVDWVIIPGTLTVLQGDSGIAGLTYEPPTYGDKVSDIVITGKYLGTWEWEDPDRVIDDINGITVYATYTPFDTNYRAERMEIHITGIKKKTLTITVTESEFTYSPDGEFKLAYDIAGVISPEHYAEITVVGNDPEFEAGTYTRTLEIVDDRYDGKIIVSLVVNKATPITDFTHVYETDWREGGITLGDFTLPAGYAWSTLSSVSKAGEYTFDAIFTPDDTNNYVTVVGQFKVVVNKIDTGFAGILDSYAKDYDSTKFDIKNSGIAAYYTDGTLSIRYFKDGEEVEEIVNSGEYTVVISVTEGTNYFSATETRVVTVNAVENRQSVITSQSAIFGDSLSVLTLPQDLEGTWSWLESEIGAAGTKTFTAVYTPDAHGNYLQREVKVTVSVSKKTVKVPTISDKEFTGEEISQGLLSTDEYTVSGDLTATNVGTYTVTFTLIDPDNHEWFGEGEHVSVTRSYKISEAPNSWVTEPADMTVAYNGSSVRVPAAVLHGDVSIVYTLNGVVVDAPVTVGTYKATVTSTDHNYDELTKTVTIVITKAIVTTPTVPEIYTYNGTVQGIIINDDNYGLLYTAISETKGLNAGEAISLTLKLSDADNYKWSTTDGDTVTFNATVSKATVSFTNATSIDKNSWFYTEAEGIVSAATLSDTSLALGALAELKFSTNNVDFVTFAELAKTNGLLNAGNYYVKTVVAGNNNWDGIETASIAFEVKKATPDRVVPDWTGSTSHGGLYYKSYLTLSGYTVYFGSSVVSVQPITSADWRITKFDGANSIYTFNVTPTDTTNFVAASVGVTVPLKTLATIGYNGTGFATIEEALNTARSGEVVWIKPDVTGNVYILEDVTVKSGVVLVLPYGDESGAAGRNQSDVAALMDLDDAMINYNSDTNLTNLVKIAPGVTLTVTGTLEVGGELTGGGGGHISGHTIGKFAALELEDGANVIINGTAKSYGFIRNATGCTTGKVVVNRDGSIYLPWILFDYKGGTIMSAIYKDMASNATSPLQQFSFLNVTTALRINYGGNLIGTCNLVADDKVNHQNAVFVSSSSSAFIQLTDSAYSYIESKSDSMTKITDLKIYGGAKLNSFNVSIKYLLQTYICKSSEYYFALPWLYHITIDNAEGQSVATFDMPDKYKILPGNMFTVEEGAVLNINSLAIYKNVQPNADGSYPQDQGVNGYFYDYLGGTYPGTGVYPVVYPAYTSIAGTRLEDSILMVRGTLNAANIGGDIYTDGSNAKVKVTGSTTVSVKEVTGVTKGLIGGNVDSRQVITTVAKLIYADSALNEISSLTDLTMNLYYTSDSDTQKWDYDFSGAVEITLGNGYGVYTDAAVLIGADGAPYIGVYDSRETKENGTIRVMKDAIITFYLNKNQLLVLDESTSVTVNAGDSIISSAGNYETEINATGNLAPIVYYVPAITLSTNINSSLTSSVKVTYYNLNTSNVAGNSTAYAVIEVNSSYSKSNTDVTVSIAVEGIAQDKIFADVGSYESGKYTTKTTDGSEAAVKLRIEITEAESGANISVTATLDTASQGGGSCVAPDTLITLADGTQVRVDSLIGNELLLVWNLETGRFDFAPVMFVDNESEAEYQVVYLYFSDGTVVKVIGEHGFWDYDLNKYVYLDESAADYIGHIFAKQNGDELAKVQLINVEIKTEKTTAWSPVTVGHLCYFVNGMLSMPGGIGGLFNIFEVDSETMTYDLEAMEKDIAEYGLFTYEELNALCPLTEDMFYAAGGAYLKISIGKGNLTIDELVSMIERYSKYI